MMLQDHKIFFYNSCDPCGDVLVVHVLLGGRPQIISRQVRSFNIVASAADGAHSAQTKRPAVLLTSNGISTPELLATFHNALDARVGPQRVMGYIPTAVLAPSGTSKKSLGEQRRRNRQEAKRRAKALGEELQIQV